MATERIESEQKESTVWKVAKFAAILATVGVAIGVTINYIGMAR